MPGTTQSTVNQLFKVKPSSEWSFSGSRSIDNLTHGYHRYPAKFIPQIVQKLIETYTVPTDKVVDVFAGCGTTLVESKVHGRKSIGVDINPVAQLITKAKINAIDPKVLDDHIEVLKVSLDTYDRSTNYVQTNHEKIDYWFREKEKNEIAFIYDRILKVENEHVQIFFLCALSNVLKNCSKWLQRGTKPQVDPNKVIANPFDSLRLQLKKMVKKNKAFFEELSKSKNLSTECEIKLADARSTKIRKASVGAIITSPPYVTSYEYADIHQLTAYWFEYISDIHAFRKKFIGTFFSYETTLVTKTVTSKEIINELKAIDIRSAQEVANYFNNMYDVAIEMARILKPNGVACLVVGNTTMKGVKMKSAEVFAEMLLKNRFKIEKIIKRVIPHKINPTIRDKESGKFTKMENENKQLVYPEEFIIIARKKKDVNRNNRK